MFGQFKKINNESGIVLFIVLMASIIIMLFSLGILTQSMNEINYAQQQIDQITSEQLSRGIFWNAYTNSYFSNSQSVTVGIPTTMQGRYYDTTIYTNGTVTTNYDTFQ